MKISIYDADLEFAARLALVFKSTIPNCVVDYVDSLDDPSLSTSNLVVADPRPYRTRDWLTDFRRLHAEATLVLVSENTDLLSGSFGDACYALSKPVAPKDLVDLARFLSVGKVYTAGTLERGRSN